MMNKKRNNKDKIKKVEKKVDKKVNKKTEKKAEEKTEKKAEEKTEKKAEEKTEKKADKKVDDKKNKEKIEKKNVNNIDKLLEKITVDAVIDAMKIHGWIVANSIAMHIIGEDTYLNLPEENRQIIFKKVNEIRIKNNGSI